MIVSRIKIMLGALAFALGALLGQVDGCTCFAGRDLCDFIEDAAVMVHATALSRSDQADINDDVTYTVNTITIYKSEPDTSYDQVISFTTGGNSALCGIYLEIGEGYLIDLVRDTGNLVEPATGDLEAVGLCGAFRLWSSVTEEDLDILQDEGCDIVEDSVVPQGDACDNNTCSEFQECVLYTPIDRGINQYPEGYYCADMCDPSPCDADETCQLVPSPCITALGALCPPVAECSPSMTDECGTCHEFQECLLYAKDTTDEEYYCADVCDPSPCDDNEVCSLLVVQCVRAPCPPLAQCSP